MADTDEPFTSNSEMQELKDRVRELEGVVEYLTRDNDFLRETLSKTANILTRVLPRPMSLSEDFSATEGVTKLLKSKPTAP